MSNQQLSKPRITLTKDILQGIMEMARGIEAQISDEGIFTPSSEFTSEYSCAHLQMTEQTRALSVWKEVLHFFVEDSHIPFHEFSEDEVKHLGSCAFTTSANRRRKRYLQYCLEGNNFEQMVRHIQRGTPREETGVPEF